MSPTRSLDARLRDRFRNVAQENVERARERNRVSQNSTDAFGEPFVNDQFEESRFRRVPVQMALLQPAAARVGNARNDADHFRCVRDALDPKRVDPSSIDSSRS